MSYSSPSDVRLVISTTLTDSEISSIIEMSDAEINRHLGSQSTSDKLIKKLSILLTAITIKTRQPESMAVGKYRETPRLLKEQFNAFRAQHVGYLVGVATIDMVPWGMAALAYGCFIAPLSRCFNRKHLSRKIPSRGTLVPITCASTKRLFNMRHIK